MTFTIDRSIWRCGGSIKQTCKGRGATELANSQGFMCCLGQVAGACGVPFQALKLKPSPNMITAPEAKLLDGILTTELGDLADSRQTKLAWDAMDINDDETITQSEREAKLAELFAKHGHEVVFQGAFA